MAIREQERPGVALVPAPRPQRTPRLTDRAARALALAALGRMRHGELVIEDGPERHTFGTATPADPLRATITVHSPAFYRAVLGGGSRTLAQAHIDGAWDADDLVALTRIGCRNLGRFDDIRDIITPLISPFRRGLRFFGRNTRTRSRHNIHRHYDIGNEFYELMFDPTMLYSCGQYTRPDMTMHEAQVAKLDRACRWLRLTPDDHVVEVGAGWGGFALHAAKHYGSRVTTTTISREQHAYVVGKVADAGLQSHINVVMQDYRDLRGSYDKLVAIEVIESMGAQYLDAFFRSCSRLLAPDGLMFLQAIVTSHRFFKHDRYGRSFLNEYIFPGGCAPSVTAIMSCVGRVTDLRPLELEDITPGYPPTLMAWRDNVDNNIDRIREMGFDERFLRLWRLYLSYCTGAFLERRVGDVQLLLAKPLFSDERVRPD